MKTETQKRIDELLAIMERTPNQEKELENLLFGPPKFYTAAELYRWFYFDSLSQTKNTDFYKEWIGETKTNDVVVLKYTNNGIEIGSGNSEINARKDMKAVAEVKRVGKINVGCIVEQLKLEWRLPDDFVDE